MNRRHILKLIGISPLVIACGASNRTIQANALATTSQIGDILNQLLGDRLPHATLIRPGLDPHTYKATQSDLQRFNEASVIIYNGLNLEASLERVLTQMPQSKTVASLADAFSESELLMSDDGAELDPHIWFDVQLWRKAVRHVADVLLSHDASLMSHINERAQSYDTTLERLYTELQALIAEIPQDRRVLVTAHDAFGYFGRAFNFEVLGIQGISTATEAGIQDMSSLANSIVERRVPAIFLESTISPKTIEALQAAVASRGGSVKLGGELYSDSLGEPNTPAATYVGMMQHNVRTIVSALKGSS